MQTKFWTSLRKSINETDFKVITAYTNVKVKGTNDMEPGCQIEVLYLPNEPQKAKSWADLERNYTPEFLFAGIFLGAMAYLLHIGKLRLNKTRMFDEY